MIELNAWYIVKSLDSNVYSRNWPDMVPGTKFKVTAVTDSLDINGATEIKLETGVVYKADNSGWWCIFSSNDSDLITKISSPTAVKTGRTIKLDHFQGQEVEISRALFAFAGQENCDSEEYDTMQAAAEYIIFLEKQLEWATK